MMKKKGSKELYIDELNDYSTLQNKKIVGVDPGKEDLIYFYSPNVASIMKSKESGRSKRAKAKLHSRSISTRSQSFNKRTPKIRQVRPQSVPVTKL